MPTGVTLRDPRQQLFDAAERVLAREGPNALTSRAVTTEAGVAKGVLHRHFADFDAFLAELVLDRIARLDDRSTALLASAGTGTIDGNLTEAMLTFFGPVAAAIVGLIISRDGLRARLRRTGSVGIPLLAEGTAMVAAYLTAEQDLGRIAGDADIHTLAPTLIGGVHLLLADQEGSPPGPEAVRRVVRAVILGVAPPGPELAEPSGS